MLLREYGPAQAKRPPPRTCIPGERAFSARSTFPSRSERIDPLGPAVLVIVVRRTAIIRSSRIAIGRIARLRIIARLRGPGRATASLPILRKKGQQLIGHVLARIEAHTAHPVPQLLLGWRSAGN